MKVIDYKEAGDRNDQEIRSAEFDVSTFNENAIEIECLEEYDMKTIGYIEKLVRGSLEYKKYITYLKKELNLTKCSLLENINIETEPVSLEFHHFPLNLFEITDIVGRYLLATNEHVTCFDIAEAVNLEHYKNNIGLVPLTKTIHQMAHNKAILIDTSKVNGNYKKFLTKYAAFVPLDIAERIMNAEVNNSNDISKEANKNKLQVKVSKYKINYEE